MPWLIRGPGSGTCSSEQELYCAFAGKNVASDGRLAPEGMKSMIDEDQLVAAIEKHLTQMYSEECRADVPTARGQEIMRAAHESLVKSRRDAFHIVGDNEI